jgi:hypothetical protein
MQRATPRAQRAGQRKEQLVAVRTRFQGRHPIPLYDRASFMSDLAAAIWMLY